jgi:ABC-type transport system involved in cytochrome c biogenesis permease subunit
VSINGPRHRLIEKPGVIHPPEEARDVTHRLTWIVIGGIAGLAASVLGVAAMSSGRETSKAIARQGPGYKPLGDLAVLDAGRVKPLDTLAIARVKSIYGRQTIKLIDPVTGETASTWPSVAAVIDWQARPEFWDDQEILLVEYLPLKRMLLAAPVKAALADASSRATGAAKAAIDDTAKLAEFRAEDLQAILEKDGLTKEDRAVLGRYAHKLSADTKWLSANDLNAAEIAHHDDIHTFEEWFRELMGKRESGGGAKLPEMEDKASEVGVRLFTYKALRDNNKDGLPRQDIAITPRPTSQAYLGFVGAAVKKIRGETEGANAHAAAAGADPHGAAPALTALEQNVLANLAEYLDNLQSEDRGTPGTGDAAFDKRFANWLATKSDWVPLRVLLNSDIDELGRAGLPIEKIQTVRAAWSGLMAAEAAAPGQLPADKAEAVVAAARGLGAAGERYPSVASMAREAHFNRFAPFYKAPMAYGFALALLLISLGITANPTTAAGKLARALYLGGLAAFVAGIALEVYGFGLRIAISGWAPVTNMYETVIWVALVTAVIGLVLELIFRKTYSALAASGVALMATVLAANVSLLDPSIGSLQPVLRSNYWLTIHVLTIVSSYAAFALALGLGLLAVGFYLTATYRRSVGYAELLAPLAPGLALLGLGATGVIGSYRGWAPEVLGQSIVFYAVALVGAVGGMMLIQAVYAALGEAANRRPSGVGLLGAVVMLVGAVGAAAGMVRVGPEWLRPYNAQFAMWTTAVVGATWVMLGLFGELSLATLRSVASHVREHVMASSRLPVESREMAAVGVGPSTFMGVSDGHNPYANSNGNGNGNSNGNGHLHDHAESMNMSDAESRSLSMNATAARIKPLAAFVYRAMQVGVLLVAAGTILGGVWADYSWGRFWGWDPKEVWALITLLVYLVPLHGRFAGWVNTFGLVAASVACFLSVLMAWYGVNFVLGVGLHSYGFVEGGGQGIVVSCSLAILAVVLGAWWRRKLSSRAEVVA